MKACIQQRTRAEALERRRLRREPGSFNARRRHALRRVEKALAKLHLSLQYQPPFDRDVERLQVTTFLRPSDWDVSGVERPWSRIAWPGVQLVVSVPFNLTAPEIVRLILVRATLACGETSRKEHAA